ncbi:MAG: alpha/beta hydrolase [Candidatus Nanopelagicales bacterium]
MTLLDPEEVVRVAGPWTHRDVAANGARFHVAEMGRGPLVLLLHGFPMFWWTWRHALPVLAGAGYRAAAMDLRGYAGSDHPPRGYDPFTLSSDVAGVIRSLGARDAVVVGHGWGGFLAWVTAVTHPEVLRGIAPVSMPHPRRLRETLIHDREQRRASAYVYGFQVPTTPERDLLEDGAAEIGRMLSSWSATPQWPDEHTAATYRAGMLLLNTVHCALEYHRWALRSVPRPDGIRFASRMKDPIWTSVLHVQGALDPTVLPGSARGSQEYVRGSYQWVEIPDCGHFPHEERPEAFHAELLGWLDGL